MYLTHEKVSSPPDEAILWRYMDFTKFVSLLDREELFLARPDELGDPFEASLTRANIQSLDIQVASIVKALATRVGINSWHENEFESAAMWRLYSREKDGIAIKTFGNFFKDCMIDERDIHIGRVNYINYETEFSFIDNAVQPFFCKRLSFAHEHEVRAVYIDIPEGSYKGDMSDYPEGFDVGVYYKVDLSLLIQEIVVAPYATNWFLELVKSVLSRYKLEVPVSRSSLSNPAYTHSSEERRRIDFSNPNDSTEA